MSGMRSYQRYLTSTVAVTFAAPYSSGPTVGQVVLH